MKVLIAGGGIGGMSAALCLAQSGFDVEIFEQDPEFGEIGAGLQLSANCMRVLHYLGLENEIRDVSFYPEGVEIRHWKNGATISETNLGESATKKYGYPYYHIHRADLLNVLCQAAGEADNIVLHADSRVAGFSQREKGVTVSARGQEYSGDVLVGADGIHSVVREGLFGKQQPVFTGNVAWRALVPVERLPESLIRPVATAWWGPQKHFIHYYVRRAELVNCVCVVEKTGWEEESWTVRGEPGEIRGDFAGWNETVKTLVEQIDDDTCYKWALFDRPPMKQWSHGRVTLLGDACHPTLPYLAQGAAMAIEDAAVLAGCLKEIEGVRSALMQYEELRMDRTARIQLGSRRNSRIFHMSGFGAWLRNRVAKQLGNRLIDRIYRYDALNALK